MSNNSADSLNSHRSSPVIVLTNADYKRPSSILSSRSSTSSKSSVIILPINWSGGFMLTCHVFIGILLVLGSLFDFIWNAVGLVKPHIRPLREIPPLMSFILSLEVFSSMVVSIITPLVVLFGGSDRFSKRYRYKNNKIFLYSTVGVILGGLICFAIHFAIFFSSKSTHLTPYLAAGLFLFLHGLLNVRLYFELLDGGDEGNTMMLPFKTEKVDDGIEEMSEIESSTSV